MTDPTAEFFAKLARRGHEPVLGERTVSVLFDLTHYQTTDHWLVKIEKGNVSVSQSSDAADCVVQTDKALFDGIAIGDVNAFAAVLRSAMAVSGDPRLLVPLQRFFPGPPESRGPQRGTKRKSSQR